MKRDTYAMSKVPKIRCQVLDCHGSDLHRHHIVNRSISQCDDPENIVVLCGEHHRQVHKHELDLGPILTPSQSAKAVLLMGTVHRAHQWLYPSANPRRVAA